MRDVSCENCGLEVCGMRRPSSTFAAVASSHSGIAELPNSVNFRKLDMKNTKPTSV